jgi:hypothetical protein
MKSSVDINDNMSYKCKAIHDQNRTDKSFKVGDRVWLQLNKEIIQGLGNNIKAFQYGPLEVLDKVVIDKVVINTYRIILCPYMHI